MNEDELVANLFRINQTKQRLIRDNVQGEKEAKDVHYEVGKMLYNFRQRTIEMLFKVLNKRSNRRSYNWDGLNEMFKVYKIETPKIYVSLFE